MSKQKTHNKPFVITFNIVIFFDYINYLQTKLNYYD